MAVVYRSVRVVVQNSSDAVLTVDGAEVLLGEWAPGNAVGAKGTTIKPQSAVTVNTQSTVMQIGSEAFLRLGSILGPVYLHWSLPWVGKFSIRHEVERERWRVDVHVIDSEPAAIAALVTLTARGRGR
jgi:CRP-like cAMP-binding protein